MTLLAKNNFGPLFEPRPADAQAAKEQGIDSAAGKSREFVDEAFSIIADLVKGKHLITAMDVWGVYAGPKPSHPRAIGAAFIRAQKSGLIQPTNQWVKSGRPSDHNQLLRVWTRR